MPLPTSARPIVGGRPGAATAADVMNFAKSLPIEIDNSPMATGRSYVHALQEDVSRIITIEIFVTRF